MLILSGDRNIAIGRDALTTNTIGNDNVAVGNGAISLNVSGSSNVGIGRKALEVNTASNNTAVGYLFTLLLTQQVQLLTQQWVYVH
jgi:hypothetical protein